MSFGRSRLNWPLVSTRSAAYLLGLAEHRRVGVSAVTYDLGPRRAAGRTSLRHRPRIRGRPRGRRVRGRVCRRPALHSAAFCQHRRPGQEEEVGCYDENCLATRHRRDAGGSGWLCHGETCPYSSSVTSSTISPISTSTGSSLSPAGRIRLTSVLCILACGRMLCNSLSAV